MRKILILLLVLGLVVTGCGQKEKNIEGKLDQLMEKVYADIPEDEKPRSLSNVELTKDNIEGFIGTKDIKFKEALASEPMMGSIAHSVVLIRMEDSKDVEDAKKLIKEKVNPRKWICVEANNVHIESKGDLIIVILANEEANALKTNFLNLK